MTKSYRPSHTPTRARIGEKIDASMAQSSARAMQYLRNFYGQGVVFMSQFEPPSADPDLAAAHQLNPIATYANPLVYYPIFPPRYRKNEDDQQLAGVVQRWAISDDEDEAPNHLARIGWGAMGSTPGEIWSGPLMATADGGGVGQYPWLMETPPWPPVLLYDGLTVPASGAYNARMLAIVGMQVASVTLWEAPTLDLPYAQVGVATEDVAAGKCARGDESSSVTRPSLGDLVRLSTGSVDGDNSAAGATTRCMAQTGIGYSYYTASATDQRMCGENWEWRCRPKMRSDDARTVDTYMRPVMVVATASTGTVGTIGVYNTTTLESETLAIDPTWSGPTLVEFPQMSLADGDNRVWVQINTGVEKSVRIWTVAFFEEYDEE